MLNKANWYLIQQNGLHHAIAKEDAEKLDPDSYVIQQVFESRKDALTEMSRLIQLEITEVKSHVNKLVDGS
jgi:predicted HTH domain antitoxin